MKNSKHRCVIGFVSLLFILSLTACGGGGSSNPTSPPATPQNISGSGVKGPLALAIVTVYAIDLTQADLKGTVIATASTGVDAMITGLALPTPLTPPYLLEFTSDTNTIDITTGQAPVITTLRTLLTQTLLSSEQPIYATPLTTIATDLAISNADSATTPFTGNADGSLSVEELLNALPIAALQVTSTIGFGLSSGIDIFSFPPLINDATDTTVEQANVASYRAAIEALTAVVFQMAAMSGSTADQYLIVLSSDLSDGIIDGAFNGAAIALLNPTALNILTLEPDALVIPNTLTTVANIETILINETSITGSSTDTTDLGNGSALATITIAQTNPDLDSDGVTNSADNCPNTANLDQADNDTDGFGNVCDATPDGADVIAPTVPNGLAGSATDTQVNLSWNVSNDSGTGVASYNIYRNGAVIAIGSSATASYADANVIANTSYSYQVRAIDVAGNISTLSASFLISTAAMPDTTSPTVPLNLNGVATDSQVSLTWTASSDTGSGVASYNIYRDGVATPIGNSGTANFIDTNVVQSTNYSYRVNAVDVAGNQSANGVVFNISTMATPDTTAPSVPTNLNAGATNSQVSLTWSASTDSDSGVASYNIYRNSSVTPTSTSITAGFIDTNVIANTTYSYVVSAVDNAGNESAQSSIFMVTTNAQPDTTAPSVPINLSGNATASQVSLTWNASVDSESGIASYNIYRDGNTVPVGNSVTPSFVNINLILNTSYNYQVSAIDNAGNESVLSGTYVISTSETVDTVPPTKLFLIRGGSSNTQVFLEWNPSSVDQESSITSYNIYRDGNLVGNSAAPNFINNGLAPNTLYQYQVSAVDSSGNESELSTAIWLRTLILVDSLPPSAPSFPTGKDGSSASDTIVRLSWYTLTESFGSGVAYYNVYRDGNATPIGTTLATRYLGRGIYVDSGLTPNTTYSYQISAVDRVGNESELGEAFVITTLTTADTTPPTVSTFSQYSTPYVSDIFVSFSLATINDYESGLNYIEIYRDGGTAPFAITFNNYFYDYNVQPDGIYTYQVIGVDNVGNRSVLSSSITATASSARNTITPQAPINIFSNTRSGVAGSIVYLAWNIANNNPNARIFYIYRDSSATPIFSVDYPTLDFLDTDVTANVNYTYQVSVVDYYGNESARSQSVSVRVPDDTPPSIPMGVNASPLDTSIVLDWVASTDLDTAVAMYNIYRGGVLVGTSTSTTFTDTGLTDTTSYSYQVSAVNTDSLESSLSSVLVTATLDSAPDVPPTIISGPTTNTTAAFSWLAASDTETGIAEYRIYRDGLAIATVSSASLSYLDATVVKATHYNYAVAAVNGDGVEALSATIRLTTTGGVTGGQSDFLQEDKNFINGDVIQVETDAMGNFYLLASNDIVKYSADGTLQWTKTYSLPNSFVGFSQMHITNEDVVVLISSAPVTGGNATDYFTRYLTRISNSGVEESTGSVSFWWPSTNFIPQGVRTVMDQNNDIYFLSYAAYIASGLKLGDLVATKTNEFGSQLWRKDLKSPLYTGSSGAITYASIIDSNNNLVISATEADQQNLGLSTNYIKTISPAGDELSNIQFGRPTYREFVKQLRIASNGDYIVLLHEQAEDIYLGLNQAYYQMIRRITPAGQEVWMRAPLERNPLMGIPVMKMVLDSNDNIFVAYSSRIDADTNIKYSDRRFYVRKYSSTGYYSGNTKSANIDWQNITPEINDLYIDSYDNLYLVGNGLNQEISAKVDIFWRQKPIVGALTGPQNGPFLTRFGTESDEQVNAVAILPNGNIVVAGVTVGEVVPGGRVGTAATIVQGGDAFIGVFSSTGGSGSYTQFGTVAYDEIADVAVDGDGNIYTVGRTFGSYEFDGSFNGDADIMVTRHSGLGNIAWKKQIGTSGADIATSVSVTTILTGGTENIRIHVAGYSLGDLDNDGSFDGNGDPFVITFDENGNEINRLQFGTELNDEIADIVSNGKFTIAVGHTWGNMGAVLGNPASTYNGGKDVFHVYIDPINGTILPSNNYYNLGSAADDEATSVTFAADTPYIVGNTQGDIDGAGPFTSSNLGVSDIFIFKGESGPGYFGNGEVILQYGTGNGDFVNGVSLGAEQKLVLAGLTYGDFDGTGSGTQIGGGDMFIARYGLDGTYEMSRQFGAVSFAPADILYDVASDIFGNNYAVGISSRNIIVSPSEPSLGFSDMFLIQFGSGLQ